MSTKKRGVRHIDRLLNVMLTIAEDENQSPDTRLNATKQALEAMGRRKVGRKKTKEEKAVEQMLGVGKATKG